MEAIKIVGEWRRGGALDPGMYLWRRLGGDMVPKLITLPSLNCEHGNDDFEYLGPIEIVEPEPVPTPLPGCECDIVTTSHGQHFCRCYDPHHGVSRLVVYCDNRRQAILRHNAAVAAIVAMESKL